MRVVTYIKRGDNRNAYSTLNAYKIFTVTFTFTTRYPVVTGEGANLGPSTLNSFTLVDPIETRGSNKNHIEMTYIQFTYGSANDLINSSAQSFLRGSIEKSGRSQ